MFFFPLEFFLLLEFKQWRKYFSSSTKVRYKPPQEINLAKQRLQLLLITWRTCVKNGFGLVLIDFNPFLVDHKAKEITCCPYEFTPQEPFNFFFDLQNYFR